MTAFHRLPARDQDEALVAWQAEQDQCGRCGRPVSQCSDPQVTWYPQRLVCFATMEQQAADAAYERRHTDKPWHDGSFTSWAKEPSASHPYHFKFGVTTFVAHVDLDPDDHFTVPLSVREIAQPAVLRLAATDEEG